MSVDRLPAGEAIVPIGFLKRKRHRGHRLKKYIGTYGIVV